MKVSLTRGGTAFLLLAAAGVALLAALNSRDLQRYRRIRSM